MPTLYRKFPVIASLLVGLGALSGCSANPDRTGDSEGGLGPPGVNAANAPQTEAEMQKQYEQEQEEAKKAERPTKR